MTPLTGGASGRVVTCRPMNRRARGFSLVELLIVVAVFTVISAAVVPQIRRSMAVSRLQTSANQLATELNYARTIAVSRNTIFEMDLTTTSFQIVDPDDEDNPPRRPKDLEPGIFLVTRPAGTIRFYPRGNADAGVIVLGGEFDERVAIRVVESGMVDVVGFSVGAQQ